MVVDETIVLRPKSMSGVALIAPWSVCTADMNDGVRFLEDIPFGIMIPTLSKWIFGYTYHKK
jgi:hypothetical protein